MRSSNGNGSKDMVCRGCGDMGACTCFHHKMVPLFIVMIGFVFLLAELGVVSAEFVRVSWPILLIFIGLQKMAGSMCSCCGWNKK